MNVNERQNGLPFVNYADPFPVNLHLFLSVQTLLQFAGQNYNFTYSILPTQYFIHPSLTMSNSVFLLSLIYSDLMVQMQNVFRIVRCQV